VDETRALAALRDILARPEFAAQGSVDPWDIVWQAVRGLLEDFLGWLLSPVRDVVAGQASWIEAAVVVVAIAGLVAAVVYAARAVGLSVVRDSAPAARAAAQRRERSDRLWRKAHDLAAAGRLAEATRVLYLSALYALEEHDVLRIEAALTNREHALSLARVDPSAAADLAAVVQRYDRVRYGGEDATPAAFADLDALVGRARAGRAVGTTGTVAA
jgi:hypothetical protein